MCPILCRSRFIFFPHFSVLLFVPLVDVTSTNCKSNFVKSAYVTSLFFLFIQEKDRIVIAVQNLCEGFSGLVTKFVRQISGLDFVDPRGSQPRKMRMNRKKYAQRPKRVQQDEDLGLVFSLCFYWLLYRIINIAMFYHSAQFESH